MLCYAAVFLVIAIVPALFGGIAAGATGIDEILFCIVLVVALVSLIISFLWWRAEDVKRERPASSIAAGIEVALGILLLSGLAACNDADVSGSGGAARLPAEARIDAAPVGDTLLVANIKQALMAGNSFDAAALSISASNGQVTLNGTVPAEQIARIDAIVREVAGVKLVINALRPTLPASS